MSLYDDDDASLTADPLANSKWSTGINKFTPNLNKKPKQSNVFGVSSAGGGGGVSARQSGALFPGGAGSANSGGGSSASAAANPTTPSSSLPPVINLNSKNKGSKNSADSAPKFSYGTPGEKVPSTNGIFCHPLAIA